MPVQRTSVLRGPAIIEFDGATFFSRADITVELGLGTFEVVTSIHGKVDERVSERVARVRFTPAGEWEALGVLFPYASMQIGASIFGAADKPLVIQTLDGKRITFAAAALTRMPSLTLASTQQIHGEVEFTCLGRDNELWTAAGNLVATSSAAYASTAFDPSAIRTQSYTGVWGGTAPWSSITTMDGWTVEFDLQVQPLMVDESGIIDYTFGSLAVTASAQPMGITEQQLADALRLQGAGHLRGRSLQTNSADLVISGTGVSVTIKNAQLKTGGLGFGPTTNRLSRCQWIATRRFVSGVADPLFVVA